MKKLLSLLISGYLIAFFTAGPLYAASYYGCANAAINANSTFCDTPTGSCTGDNPQTAATALAGTHNLYANGCTITIPEGLTMSAAKLSNKDDGTAMVDGGQFTVSTTGWTGTSTVTANIEAGGTTGACLAITGSGNVNPVFTLLPTTIVGGSAATIYGVSPAHTVGTVVIGSSGSPCTATGGSNASGHAIRSNTAGPLIIYGNMVADVAYGLSQAASSGNMVLYGDCIGSDSTIATYGCNASGAGTITVYGNMVQGVKSAAANGLVTWAPASAKNYAKFTNGTAVYAGVGLGSDAAGTQITAANTAAQVKTTAYFVKKDNGAYTQGTATAGGGGGAWVF